MFGMLDYRAYKLYRVLGLPLTLLGYACLVAAIAAAVLIARNFDQPTWAKVAIGIVAFEAIAWLLFLIMKLLGWLFTKGFLWLIDVVPAKGGDREEAEMIAISGTDVLLFKKLGHNIEDWTDDDTKRFINITPWRSRLFFHRQHIERFRKRLDAIREHQAKTGRQFADLTHAERDQVAGPYKDPWWQGLLSQRTTINSLIALICILLFAT
jgi:hypothetical protein